MYKLLLIPAINYLDLSRLNRNKTKSPRAQLPIRSNHRPLPTQPTSFESRGADRLPALRVAVSWGHNLNLIEVHSASLMASGISLKPPCISRCLLDFSCKLSDPPPTLDSTVRTTWVVILYLQVQGGMVICHRLEKSRYMKWNNLKLTMSYVLVSTVCTLTVEGFFRRFLTSKHDVTSTFNKRNLGC